MSGSIKMPYNPKEEHVGVRELNGTAESLDDFTPEEWRKIKRKIDLRLLPALGIMYSVALMDRKNVANAYIAGMAKDPLLSVEVKCRCPLQRRGGWQMRATAGRKKQTSLDPSPCHLLVEMG